MHLGFIYPLNTLSEDNFVKWRTCLNKYDCVLLFKSQSDTLIIIVNKGVTQWKNWNIYCIRGLLLSTAVLAKVNINTATVEELAMLKGLGEAKAQAIVDYREENGKFEKVEDIVNVKGVGDKLLEKLREDLSVEGETSFDDVENIK